MKKKISKEALSWALYDWANSAFATTVMTALFPIFFKKYWSQGTDFSVSTAQLGSAHAMTSAILAALSPILGAIADHGSKKKLLLVAFAFLGILSTGSLALAGAGDWQTAILLFIVGNIGFAASNSLYDALLISVSDEKDMGFISALGYSLGYLGGGLLFLLNLIMITKPALFGFIDAAEATRYAFVSVAVWWTVFSLPLFLFVPERRAGLAKVDSPPLPFSRLLTESFTQLMVALRALLRHRNIRLFLLAYFFYIDGVNTIIKMSVDYGVAIGLKHESLILAILIVQFVGFPATLGFGFLASRWGEKISLFTCLGAYMAGTIYSYFMSTETEFFALAVLIGLVQGGTQSISRAIFGGMIPPGQAGQFFGVYNMLGKFSSVLGPLLMAVVSLLSRDPRISILSVIVLFVIGVVLLALVPIAQRNEN